MTAALAAPPKRRLMATAERIWKVFILLVLGGFFFRRCFLLHENVTEVRLETTVQVDEESGLVIYMPTHTKFPLAS